MNEPRCDIDRTITLPQAFADALVQTPAGRMLEIPVEVNWPELQLSERQILANALARSAGQIAPYPDPSIFSIRVPYPNWQEETKESQS